MRYRIIVGILISIFSLCCLFLGDCGAGILLLWPEVPAKPVINLTVENPITKEIAEREMTTEEVTAVALYEAKQGNFETVRESLKGSVTGKYTHVIGKGPVWSKDGIRYSIAYFADLRRIKSELKPSGTCQVIDTKDLGGANWLRKNGYKAEGGMDVLVEKDISR